MRPVVEKDKCTGCGICTEVCPEKAIVMRSGKAFITIECIEYGACISECPEGAIVQPME